MSFLFTAVFFTVDGFIQSYLYMCIFGRLSMHVFPWGGLHSSYGGQLW